jgi:hypothetical protein
MGDDSYIVRIYRRDPKNNRLVAGTVEEVGVEGKKGFGSFDELQGILSDGKRGGKRRPPGADQPESKRHS